MTSAGDLSTAAFLAVVAAVFGFFVLAARRSGGNGSAVRAALVQAALLGVTFGLARAGVLRDFEKLPPPLLRVVLALVVANLAFAFSRRGLALATGVPLFWLVGLQAFRFPLELVLHAWYAEGALPVQMTYAGRNLDILTGVLAIPLALALRRGPVPRWIPWAFDALGFVLLANIVGVAVASLPGPLRVFMNEPANLLVAEAPYVWLPAFLVQAALLGHLLLLRRLRADPRRDAQLAPTA